MPRRALRCYVDINIHAITCPGVWLPHRDDVFISMRVFDQFRQTQLSSPIFPLLFHEKFCFDKVFYTAFEPSQVAEALENCTVLIELIQLSDIYEGGRLLAHYEGNAREFLYPYPSFSPSYGTQDRNVLMQRTLDFPGISPKLEFSTRTTLKETHVSLYDHDEEDLYTPRSSRSRSRSRSLRKLGFSQPTISSITRSRSVSPGLYHRLDALDLESSYPPIDDSKPPFVVRKVKKDLIGRTPGGPGRDCFHGSSTALRPLSSGSATSLRSKKRRKPKKGKAKGRNPDYCLHCREPFTERNCTICQIYHRYTGKKYWGHSCFDHPTGHQHKHVKFADMCAPMESMRYSNDDMYWYSMSPSSRLSQIYREPGTVSPYPLYKYNYFSDPDADDLEVARLTRSNYGTYTRPRTTSPLLYHSTLTDRYDERPWSLAKSDLITSRVQQALRRNRSLERLDRLSTSPYTGNYLLSKDYDDSLSDLARDLERAKYGRYYI